MVYLFLTLVIIASVVLAFIILVQNPKGGGLSGSVGGLNNQLMGVKQTTDVLEKGTWTFAGIIAVLAIVSALFIKGSTGSIEKRAIDNIPTSTSTPSAPTPAPTQSK